MIKNLTARDISRSLSSTYLERGQVYYRQGKVTRQEIHLDGNGVTAIVSGSGRNAYHVKIRLVELPGGGMGIDGECSCPVAYNCKHVAAALISAHTYCLSQAFTKAPGTSIAKPKPIPAELPQELMVWLQELERASYPAMDKDALPHEVTQRLLYVLKLTSTHPPQLGVSYFISRVLKAGGFGKAQPHHTVLDQRNPARYLTERDQDIVATMSGLRARQPQGRLRGEVGARVVTEMIATGRCFWETTDGEPLALGEKRSAQPLWTMDDEGNQKLTFTLAEPAHILPFAPPWYLDEHTGLCGEIDSGLSATVAQAMAEAPLIPPTLIQPLSRELARKAPAAQVPLPQTLQERQITQVVPVPCLRLSTVEVPVPSFASGASRFDLYVRSLIREPEPEIIEVAQVEFDYDGIRITGTDSSQMITRLRGAELWHILRQDDAEKRHIEEVECLGFLSARLAHSPLAKIVPHGWILADNEDWTNFCLVELPALKAAGWRVEVEPGFRFDFAQVDEWTATVEEGSGNDWFGLELGIQVDGQKLNLTPILLNLIRQFPKQLTPAALAQMTDDQNILIGTLPDGRPLILPPSRVRGILSVLVELFDKDAQLQRLELSPFQAARLVELEEAHGDLRWMGGERLRELGRKLQSFEGIRPVPPPAGLMTGLRGYQQEGLNWLQFLREYDLAGILADDMGLGKTVQALAHLLVEKESGRMTHPCLVVAPTSLMFNWHREAERFAPSLRVLVLQGLERKQHFDALGNYDLVLTTYPLLPRDREVLTGQQFHTLILDEAHIIKNPKSQATLIVHQIQARHRLALTGTPLENHLGELWTLFHFLLPGLLGHDKSFRKLFRTPIEKQGNSERRGILARRIAPFLLRRTKSQVAQELPPKTEMVRYCQLEGPQRDLYEAIRVAMHEKVQQEIDKKGMNRSQIIILDALLKLRQVCCDPRLLKLPAAQKVKQSAKLELLMGLLPDMLEEGRRILLFSQFTSMLALIEEELMSRELPYVILTGDTPDRATPVNRFQQGEVSLFLISLKAGGVGLNLTAADTVIHYDPWWTPAVENQATDRAHRIGQENPVFVYKLLTEGTLEEKIIALQERKRDLAQGVLAGAGEATTSITATELAQLFEPLG